jgi:hypothetical protein
MNVNFNTSIASQAYKRELYGAENQGGSRPEQVPEAAQVRPGQVAGRDSLFLSAEARRLYQVNRDLNVNENILNQQGDIYRPGLEETVLRSEESLQPQRAEQAGPPRMDRPEVVDSDDLNKLELELRVTKETADQTNNNDTSLERISTAEADRSVSDRHNLTSETANINTVNSSTLIQAYAAAANVNQASYTVNFKV